MLLFKFKLKSSLLGYNNITVIWQNSPTLINSLYYFLIYYADLIIDVRKFIKPFGKHCISNNSIRFFHIF